MDYPVWVRKSADLHIQDGRHGLICIFEIDVNALQSLIFIRSSQIFFSTLSDRLSWSSLKISWFAYSTWPSSSDLHDFFPEHPLMDYSGWARKSANLHGHHGLICIFKIDINALQSPIFIQSSRFFFSTLSDRLSWSNLKINWFAYSTWLPWANSYIHDRRKRSPVANVCQIFAIFFLNTLWWISLVEFENQLICISKMVVMSLMLYSPICNALAKNF